MQYRAFGPFRGGWSLTASGLPGDPTTYYFGSLELKLDPRVKVSPANLEKQFAKLTEAQALHEELGALIST